MNFKRLLTTLWSALGLLFFLGLVIISPGIKVNAPDKELIGNFIQWFGLLFSILLALVIVQAWRKHNTVNSLVDKEADALISLLRFARFLENLEIFDNLARAIYDYCAFLSSAKDGSKDSKETLEQVFHEVLDAVRSSKQPFLAGEMIRGFDEAADARGDRFALVQERIPGALWFMMVFTSMIWLLGLFWLSFQDVNVYVAGFVLFSTMFTVLGLLFIAKDIDNPMSGVWKISFASFDEACKEIRHMQRLVPKTKEKKQSSTTEKQDEF